MTCEECKASAEELAKVTREAEEAVEELAGRIAELERDKNRWMREARDLEREVLSLKRRLSIGVR